MILLLDFQKISMSEESSNIHSTTNDWSKSGYDIKM